MQHVKYLKAAPGILEGSVRQVDENSAAVLAKRGTVEIIKPEDVDKARAEATPFPRATRGNLTVTQIAEADVPSPVPADPATTSEEADGVITTGTGAGEHVDAGAPPESATKAELVDYLENSSAAGGLDRAGLEALTKPELRAKLG